MPAASVTTAAITIESHITSVGSKNSVPIPAAAPMIMEITGHSPIPANLIKTNDDNHALAIHPPISTIAS